MQAYYLYMFIIFVHNKQSGPLRSHAAAAMALALALASTRAEILSSIDWLSHLEVRNVSKILKKEKHIVRYLADSKSPQNELFSLTVGALLSSTLAYL